MKALILGDLHGWPSAPAHISSLVETLEPDEVWQCGDFGYWPRMTYGPDFLDKMSGVGAPIFFADGNHEDHDRLDHDADRPYRVPGAVGPIYHVPRGVVRVVNGKRILFMGGARSVDRVYRREGRSWFATELPTPTQFQRAKANGPVDVIISHDGPSIVDFGYPPHHLAPWPIQDLEISEITQRRMTDLGEAVRPKLWFHGHHHQARVTPFGEGTVYSLHEYAEPGWWQLLDLDTLEVVKT